MDGLPDTEAMISLRALLKDFDENFAALFQMPVCPRAARCLLGMQYRRQLVFNSWYLDLRSALFHSLRRHGQGWCAACWHRSVNFPDTLCKPCSCLELSPSFADVGRPFRGFLRCPRPSLFPLLKLCVVIILPSFHCLFLLRQCP